LDDRESELCNALLDAYPQPAEFEELVADTNRNLNTIVDSSLNLRVIVRRVVRIAKSEGWLPEIEAAALHDKPHSPRLRDWHGRYCAPPRPGQPAGAGTGPAWQQFDPVYFDLISIRAEILRIMIAPPGPVIGFGVRSLDFAFTKKLLNVVAGHLDGQTQHKEPLHLKPHLDRVSRKVERVRGWGRDLDTSNVLCSLLVNAVPHADLADFWSQVRQEFGGSSRHFILVFMGDEETVFPAGVAELPPPRFGRDDLRVWAVNIVMQLNAHADTQAKWPVSLAAAWADLLCAHAEDGTDLDVGMVYEEMDSSLIEFRFDTEGFRRKLENRMAQ
jgi:hypothetical protein